MPTNPKAVVMKNGKAPKKDTKKSLGEAEQKAIEKIKNAERTIVISKPTVPPQLCKIQPYGLLVINKSICDEMAKEFILNLRSNQPDPVKSTGEYLMAYLIYSMDRGDYEGM